MLVGGRAAAAKVPPRLWAAKGRKDESRSPQPERKPRAGRRAATPARVDGHHPDHRPSRPGTGSGPTPPPALSAPRAASPAVWTPPPSRAHPHGANPEPSSPPPPPPRAPTPAPSGNPGNREHHPLPLVRPRLVRLRLRVGHARAPRPAPRLSGRSGVAGVTRGAAEPKGK